MPSLARRTFEPVRQIVNKLLLGKPAEYLNNAATRALLLDLADKALLNLFPSIRILPAGLRHRIIGRVLDNSIGSGSAAAASASFEDDLTALALTAEETALLEIGAPGNSVTGFLADGETNDLAAMTAAVQAVLGGDWKVEDTEPGDVGFRITSETAILSSSDGWELAHKLEDHAAVALAEPIIPNVPAPPEIGGEAPDIAVIAGFGGDDLGKECSYGAYWSGEKIAVQAGWDAAPVGRKQGAGVRVVHLDTGVRPHNFLAIENNPNIDYTGGRNLFDPNTNPKGERPFDPQTDGFGDQPGHGIQTISVLLCKAGTFEAPDKKQYTPAIRGVAPEAIAVPFRISPTVINIDTDRMTRGFNAAVDANCDVITMSMGGPEPRTGQLRRAIKRAVEAGIIVCTAAGNKIGSNDIFPIVVWPAAYDEVIAVAGTNCEDKKWRGSSRGPEVNISAPAESVWRLDGKDPTKVGQGDGTSYATPAVAGVAACWLAAHGGRQALIQHYGKAKYVPLAFAHLLKTVGYRRPANWDTRLMGPGIIDAGAIVRAALPAKATLTTWPVKQHTLSSAVIAAIFKALGYVIPGVAADVAAAASADDTPEAKAARYGTELVALLMDRPLLLKELVESGVLAPSSDSGVAAAAGVGPEPDRAQAATALSTLRQLASPSLAAALK